MLEKAGAATIDDILKEHVLAGLPVDLKDQQHNPVRKQTHTTDLEIVLTAGRPPEHRDFGQTKAMNGLGPHIS